MTKRQRPDNPPLVRDWDHVTMADYQKDMRESADYAAGIIRTLRRDYDRLLQMFMLVVHNAGGKVVVYESDLIRPPKLTLTRENFEHDRTIVYSTKVEP